MRRISKIKEFVANAMLGMGFVALAASVSYWGYATAHSHPKFVYVGDSLAVGYGMAAPEAVKGLVLAKNSTGLINRKLRNWPEFMAQHCYTNSYRYMVVSLGANDIQSIGSSKVGSQEWSNRYEDLLVEFFDAATRCNAQIILVEPPLFADKREVQLKAIRAVLNRFCVDGVICIKTSEILSEKGKYSATKVVDGKTITTRSADGVHMTWKGYELIGKEIEKAVK